MVATERLVQFLRGEAAQGITITAAVPRAGRPKASLKHGGSKGKADAGEKYGSYAVFSDISNLVVLRTLFAYADRADPSTSSWARIDEVHGTLHRAAQDKTRTPEQRWFLQQMYAIARRKAFSRSGVKYISFAEFFEGLTPDLNDSTRERMLMDADVLFRNQHQAKGGRGSPSQGRLPDHFDPALSGPGEMWINSKDGKKFIQEPPPLAVERFVEYRKLFNSIASGRLHVPRADFLHAFQYCVADPADLARLLDEELPGVRDLCLEDFLAVILPAHKRETEKLETRDAN